VNQEEEGIKKKRAKEKEGKIGSIPSFAEHYGEQSDCDKKKHTWSLQPKK
jgi:hypothetical protein